MQSLLILGRQPALGLAELESLYGASAVKPLNASDDGAAQRGPSELVLVDLDPSEIAFERLGGSIKLCAVLGFLDDANWGDIENQLIRTAPELAASLPEGKLQLGVSTYGIRLNTRRLTATGLTLKKVIKQTGRSVRLVPNKELALNSASVLHNNLTGPTGLELVLARSSNRTIVARTVREQDIESYTARDRDRPRRDARVGMLPPKLAQVIINLAVGLSHPVDSADGSAAALVVLDPFCGTGVLLQEALLMGYSAYGSDIEPRMIDYSTGNIEWLKSRAAWLAKNIDEDKATRVYLEVQDATNFENHGVIDVVASETYLGRPFTALPSPELLNQTVSDCNLIIKKFLVNIRTQLPRGARLCLAVPAWQVGRGQFKHLPFIGSTGGERLDSLRELGYNRISFEHARDEELIYFREDQTVARELLVLEKL